MRISLIDVRVLASLRDFDVHANFNPASQLRGICALGILEQRTKLHAKTPVQGRSRVHITQFPQRSVRLDAVPNAVAWVYVGKFAAHRAAGDLELGGVGECRLAGSKPDGFPILLIIRGRPGDCSLVR